MKAGLLLITVFALGGRSYAQDKNVNPKRKADTTINRLKEVVVTGQYAPQSIRNSVYQTRVISAERIRLRAATTIQQVLSTELGFRFQNDMTLGTSDVQLMGMTGRNVKILLDGVPMVDRSDTRESLNQIDINTVERIEIVEGPLSVSYGSDALAGVINIITKKPAKESLTINARVQEETVGDEYSPFSKSGNHLQHLGGGWQKKGFSVLAGLTHNDFNGFNVPAPLMTAVEVATDPNRWRPKEQWLANTKLGYRTKDLDVVYRLDYVNEDILAKGAYSPGSNTSFNQQYITDRYTQQLQGAFKLSDRLSLNTLLGYSNLKRSTLSKLHDYATGADRLTTGAGEQDISKFRSTSLRTTLQYKLSDLISFQPGVEINLDNSSGARILGDQSINDYAFFVSSELKLLKDVVIRPGLRFISNSKYDAPPVIPSINTKIRLNDHLDLRFGYANGFRSPALRELYYDFVDANHKILGNPDLKAEQSDSFSASLSLFDQQEERARFKSVLSGFYNNFRNRIMFEVDAADPSVTRPMNIEKYKTTGGTFENTFFLGAFQASVGLSYIGTYNKYSTEAALYGESDEFVWSPELNTNLTYTFGKSGTTLNLAYKFSGRKQLYELQTLSDGTEVVRLGTTSSFHMADLMLTQKLMKSLTLNGGVKNLFDVTTLNNTAVATGAAHSSSGPVPTSYGRSFVLGLSFSWSKD